MPANKPSARRLRTLHLGIVSAVLVLLPGCESIPQAVREMPVAKVFKTTLGPKDELPAPKERVWPDSAQDVLNQRARGFGLVNAPEFQRYLNGLYTRVKTQAGVPDWPGNVHILASDALQAYATGAGNIYVSLPWLISVQTEDELVALLSHEFGHIYLHYHQLEGAVADADTTAGLLSLGVGIAKKTAQATGWTQVDSLMTAYTLGRGLVTTVYGRSQESAADAFGLNISLKLGYSYEHGLKSFLERLASWEDTNAQLEKERNEKLLQAIRQQAKDKMLAGNPPPNNAVSQAMAQASGDLSGSMAASLQEVFLKLNKATEAIRSDHPPIVERIDVLEAAVEPFPDLQGNQPPVAAPLQKVRQDKRTATLLANYASAFKAIKAPQDPASVELARKSTLAPTATHAVPLFAYYTVLNAQPASAKTRKIDPGQVLVANFASDADRSWITYQERSSKLQAAQQIPAAKKVMDEGLAHFQNAEEAWPQAIRFYGETQGWDEAKRMAKTCSQNFRRQTQSCTLAAATPAERAETERQSKEKAEQIAKKIVKKP